MQKSETSRVQNQTNRDSNPDLVTEAPGSHPVATGVGALAAGAAGAAIGSVVPGIGTVIGGVVGTIAGSVGGGYAGKAVGEMIDPTEDDATSDRYWRENHKTRSYARDSSYDELKPAYLYGSSVADRMDMDAYDESRIRKEWEASENKRLPYGKAAPAIRDAFDRKLKLRQERMTAAKQNVSTGAATTENDNFTVDNTDNTRSVNERTR